MKRIYFILATTLSVAFTSCTNDEFVGGEDHGTPQAMSDAITFGGNAGKLTRATSNTGTVAQMLYDKTNGIMAWSRIIHGGKTVKSIAVTRGEDENDLIFMVVKDGDNYFLELLDLNYNTILYKMQQ